LEIRKLAIEHFARAMRLSPLDGDLFPGHESPPSLASGDRDSEVAVIFNDGGDLETGYIDARPLTIRSTKTSCNARPDHTFGSFSTKWGCPPLVRFNPDTGRTANFRFGSFVPEHEVAALQPAAREQEPRGRQPIERTGMARWQGQHDQLMYCRRATHDQEQQGSSGRPAP
jgi:hypothetical protein